VARSASTLLPLALAALVIALSCDNNDTGNGTATPAAGNGVAGTAASPEATATAERTVEVEPVALAFEDAFPSLPNLERPVDLVEVPGQGLMLVVLQDGRVLSFPKDPEAATLATVLDWRQRTSRSSNEEGMLGIALDPDFERNGYAYLYYSATNPRRSVLSRFTASGAGAQLRFDPASELAILEIPQPFGNHNAGKVAFGPDGMLYVALGDGGGGGDPQGNAQDRGTLLGSILRIDVRNATAQQPYAIPAGNPFVGEAGARGEIWAYGLRNPWRFSFDRETGDMWVADVGQGRWEEVNVGRAGANYGWNIMEGPECYQPRQSCPQEGLTMPVAWYTIASAPHCAIIGGYAYRGELLAGWQGLYFYADFCSGRVWALDGDAGIAGDEVQPVVVRETGPAIVGFGQDVEGELYLLSFDGRIYALTAAS
jgi:glucose/arabinose dehydrogenase